MATYRAGADPNEQAIVRAVLAGDRDAYRELVERESGSVIRTCHRILGDLAEAEDVAQEAFVTAYRALGAWRADGPFGAWLARIAVRLATRRASTRRQVVWIEPGDQASVPASGDGMVAGRTDPLQATLRGEREAAVRTAVAELREPYREVVALRFFAERSLQEIADTTGRPLGTVKTHLRRGLALLRSSLDDGLAR